MEALFAKRNLRVKWSAEHRDNFCENCNIKMVTFVDDKVGQVKRHKACPRCGGSKGRLISTSLSIQPPEPPKCISFKCIWRFMKDSLFCLLLSSYHSRRVAYAEANRGKVILERYRTGKPSPENIWQAIHANLKIKCPICRKYDKDPLLFRR